MKFAKRNFQLHLLDTNLWTSNQICVEYMPQGLIQDKSELVQVMAWRLIGAKPLPGPMLTKIFGDTGRH